MFWAMTGVGPGGYDLWGRVVYMDDQRTANTVYTMLLVALRKPHR
jgi:hypothetical protein